MPSIQLEEEEKVRRLVLHFGIPRTLCTWDRVNGRTTEAELNKVLCEMGWGTLDLETGAWVMVSEEPCPDRPDTSLISYWEYLQTLFPTGSSIEESTREENIHQVTERSSRFTTTNEPGQKFRPMYEQMVRCLAVQKTVMKGLGLPKVILDEYSLPEEDSADEAMSIVRFGRYQLLPSFFNLLIVLQREARQFSIVFHSFNHAELDALQKEITMFCEGRHPCYNGQFKTKKMVMTGESGSRDLRMKKEYMGVMQREKETLTFSDRNSVPAPDDGGPPTAPFTPTVYKGGGQIYAGLLKEVLEETNCVGVLDDHEYWTENDESSSCGKVLYVEDQETKVQHIFFDGNIHAENTHCVDVRDASSEKPFPYEDVEDVHFHRVNTVQAIVDPEYYIKALQKCEAKHLERITGRKRAEVEKEETGTRLSREELLKLPAKEYLYKTVMPGLLPALELCQRDRPEDPIGFLAFQLLRHPFTYKKELVDQ